MVTMTGHTSTGSASAVMSSTESPDIVNLKQISERLGVAYITVQKWWRGERGKDRMPEPITRLGGRNPIWEWETIAQWCWDTGRTDLLDNARRGGWPVRYEP